MNAPAWLLAEHSKAIVSAWNALVTSVYKLVGFFVLTLILVGLVCYFGVNAFYLFADTWVAPVILSPNHERVLQLNSHGLQLEHQRRKLESERFELVDQVQAADRAIALSELFQSSFKQALSQELASRQEYLQQALPLEERHRTSQRAVIRANEAFLSVAEPELDAQYEAGLIDRATHAQAKRSLAAMAQSELSLRETGLQLSTVVRDSKREIEAMQGTLGSAEDGEPSPADARSYDVLVMQQQFHQSVIDADRLRRERESALRLIALLDESIESYDLLLAEIEASPYKRALGERVHLAFAPYENLDEVSDGKALYGCSGGLVWCGKVGSVVGVLDGEVTVKHPLHSELIRGLMLEIDLDDPKWAEEKALYLGSAPLLF